MATRRAIARRSPRKSARAQKPDQKDLLAQLHPLCPECKGDGRKLLYQLRGRYTNQDWAYMKFAAQALGTWETLVRLEPHFVALIERKIAKARFLEGDRYYSKCPKCGGSGHLTPEYEAYCQKLREFTNKAVKQAILNHRQHHFTDELMNQDSPEHVRRHLDKLGF